MSAVTKVAVGMVVLVVVVVVVGVVVKLTVVTVEVGHRLLSELLWWLWLTYWPIRISPEVICS
jgi:hypothetical protein